MIKASPDTYLKYIAYMQVIGIILVVLGHSFHEYPCAKIVDIIYAFHMPLFMYVSGFLLVYTTIACSNSKMGISIIKFTSKKACYLLLPFFIITLFTFVPRAIMSNMADEEIELSFISFSESLIHGKLLIIPYFWFLQANFILTVVLYICLVLSKIFKISEVVTIIFLIFGSLVLKLIPIEFTDVFSINQCIDFAIYFMLGALSGRYYKSIERIKAFDSYLFFLCSALLFVLLYMLNQTCTYFSIIVAISGIIMCMSLSRIIVKTNFTWLDHLLGANYIIFLLSWFCNIGSQQILHHFIELPWIIYTILSLVTGIYIPLLIYRYLIKHSDNRFVNIFARLLGQKIT